MSDVVFLWALGVATVVGVVPPVVWLLASGRRADRCRWMLVVGAAGFVAMAAVCRVAEAPWFMHAGFGLAAGLQLLVWWSIGSKPSGVEPVDERAEVPVP